MYSIGKGRSLAKENGKGGGEDGRRMRKGALKTVKGAKAGEGGPLGITFVPGFLCFVCVPCN